jgi:plasmid maintenance system antidote protein VapI
MKISDELRKAVADSGMSANSLAEALDIAQTTISRFLRGEDTRLSVADKLAAYFNLSLQPDPPATPKRATKAKTK